MRLVELALFTDNVDATAEFYRVLLGVTPKVRAPGIAIFERDGYEVLVHETYAPGPDDVPCEDHAAYAVASVDATWDRLLDAGLTPEIAPRSYEWGRSAYLRDPDGRLIEIHGRPRSLAP